MSAEHSAFQSWGDRLRTARPMAGVCHRAFRRGRPRAQNLFDWADQLEQRAHRFTAVVGPGAFEPDAVPGHHHSRHLRLGLAAGSCQLEPQSGAVELGTGERYLASVAPGDDTTPE